MLQATLFDGVQAVHEPLRNPVLTARVGKNAPLFADICRLYVPEGSRVLDMTYGYGHFWESPGLAAAYDLITMDIERQATVRASLKRLPFKYDTFDAVILDPPYATHGGRHSPSTYDRAAELYNLDAENSRQTIAEFYDSGIGQGWLVLKQKGVLIVKCQDAEQTWWHIKVLNESQQWGFKAEDLFVLVQEGVPPMRHPYQHHARKNHSYFWVFRK